MKNFLLIGYAYPPISSPGAVRATRMLNHLNDYGWQGHVLTVKDGYSQRIGGLSDPLSNKADYVFRVADPIAKANTKYSSEKPSANKSGEVIKSHIKSIAKSLLFPGRSLLWSLACCKWGKTHVGNYELIYSTSPTPSTHIAGYSLSKVQNIPWIAEFRDPISWLSTDHSASRLRKFALKKYEAWVVKHAAAVVVVSETFKEYYDALYPHANIISIPNGTDFNKEDLIDVIHQHKERRNKRSKASQDRPYRLVHTGALYGQARPTGPIIQAAKLAMQKSDIKLELLFAGNDAYHAVEAATDLGCPEIVKDLGILPHNETIELLRSADLTLSLLINEPLGKISIMSKFLDYLPAGAPILNLGDNDFVLSRIVKEQQAGASFPYEDIEGIADWLINLPNIGQPDTIRLCEDWSAQKMAQRMADLFLSIR